MSLSKFNNYTESFKIENGNIVHHNISQLNIDPTYKIPVHASVYFNGEHFEKEFDSLDNFYNGISKSNYSLLELLKKDTDKLKKNLKKKTKNKTKYTKQNKTFKKPKNKRSIKKK